MSIVSPALDPSNMDFAAILKQMFLFVSRPNSVQRLTMYGAHFQKNIYQPLEYVLNVPISETDSEIYFPKTDVQIMQEKQTEEFLQPNFLSLYKERDERFFQDWVSVGKEVGEAFSKSPGDKRERVMAAERYYAYPSQDETYFYFSLAVWSFEQKTLPVLEATMKKYYGSGFEKAWETIVSQTELTEEQQMRIDIASLKNNPPDDLKEKLSELQTKYRHLGIYSPEDHGFTLQAIQKIYEETDANKILEMEQQVNDHKKSFQDLLAAMDDDRIRDSANLINFNVHFRTIRSEKLSYGFSLATPMYEYLEQALGYSRTEIGNLTREEVLGFLQDDIVPPKRTQQPAMLYIETVGRELTAPELNTFMKEFRMDAKSVESFKGTIAYKGLAKGTAKIIRSVNELNKVQPGDVLVSSFTRPEYLPAIGRAVAIVTDDGGITCHTAIVSRELKKPCIIGTKIATKVLHDGDEIEVDATQGVVKIIKKTT